VIDRWTDRRKQAATADTVLHKSGSPVAPKNTLTVKQERAVGLNETDWKEKAQNTQQTRKMSHKNRYQVMSKQRMNILNCDMFQT